ncbi:MAG: LysR family transcriptional regulator [Bacilli bacterium]|nr:LysR family transcriptional regulator [Bacilli bacterium]
MYQSNINLNLYKTFYEVAKYGSITETAKNTFTSQPAISKSIKKLEEELKTQLFYRNRKGIELTEKGKDLLFYIESAYNSLITAERSMFETETLERGKISIGVPSQIGTFFIFDNIAKFHKEHPNIEITLITGKTSTLISLLKSHKVDFIIDSSPIDVDSKDIIIKPLTEVNNCFIYNNKTNLKGIDKIKSIKDLANYPLILPIKGTDNRNQLDYLFKSKSTKINNVINIHTSEMIVGAVKQDLGIGYIIYDLIKPDIDNNEINVLDIKEQLPTITINLVYIKKYLTTAPLKFIQKYIDSNINN